ncbi:protein kinase [Candidatus Sumerlaeota bacterium]|nr:protein kinase [Candidatus Sumerlaeota bacterium]
MLAALAGGALAQGGEVAALELDLERANAPLAFDLVHDPSPEIIATDVRGNLRMIGGDPFKVMDSASLGREALTAAGVGVFDKGGSYDLVVGTSSGRLVFLDGQTLDVIAEKKIGQEFSLQPTVFSGDGDEADRVVVVDRNGEVLCAALSGKNEVEVLWRFATGTRPAASFAIGPVRATGKRDLAGTTADGRIALIDEDGQGELLLVQQNAIFSQEPLLFDGDRDGRMDLYAISDSSQLYAMTYDANAAPRLKKRWTAEMTGTPVSAPLVVWKGNDHADPVILVLTEASLAVLDPMTKSVIAKSTNEIAAVTAAPGLIPRTGRYPELAFAAKGGIQVTANLHEWIESRGASTLQVTTAATKHDVADTVVVTLNNGIPVVSGISHDTNGMMSSYRATQFSGIQWQNATPWMTDGGDPEHSSQLATGPQYHAARHRAAGEKAAAAWKAEFDRALGAREWGKAEEQAKLLQGFDPYNDEYAGLGRKVVLRRYLSLIVIVGGGVLAVLAGCAVFAWKFFGAKQLQRRAENAVGRKDYEDAEKAFAQLAARTPNDPAIVVPRAKIAIARGAQDAQVEQIFHDALKAAPHDTDILNALARRYLATNRRDQDAVDVFTRALPSYPEPQWLEYALASAAMETGHHEEAGKRFRAALRGGVQSEELYRSLCDVYLKTKSHGAKSLPVFQQQYASRVNDREFLVAYLSACIDARAVDARLEELCGRVLAFAPTHVPALLASAMIFMQRSQFPQAIERAESALKVEPGNVEAEFLLAQCHMSLNRRDAASIATVEKALAANPNDANLLKYLATVYFDAGNFDNKAFAIYQRAHAAHPNDLTPLKALAKSAEVRRDDDLCITVVEAVMAQNQVTPELQRQVAHAYARRRVYEPKAENVYREVLKRDGDNAELTAALARTCALQDRDDRDSVSHYEKHLANDGRDIVVGKQYAKAMVRMGNYEKARSVSSDLLKQAPDDEELQRLTALASLYDNKLEAAAVEYRRMLEKNPNDEEALVNLALTYIQTSRADAEGLNVCQQALAMQPENDALHLGLGRLFVLQGDAARGVESFKAALKVKEHNERNVIAHVAALLGEKPEQLRARWFLIEVLVGFGYLREALEQIEYITQNHPGQTSNIQRALEQILAKDPNNVMALAQRGSILVSAGNTPEGVKALERAFALNPASADVQGRLIGTYQAMLQVQDIPDMRFKLGKVFFARADFDQAIGSFQKTAQLSSLEAESTKLLGKCFTGKGMLDLALQEYKKLVVDNETKELLYDLAQRYEQKRDLVGAKTVYRQLFAADIDYKDVKTRFEMLSGSTSDPMAFEKTAIVQQMSEEAARRYELLDELGRGAMGIVYRARDKELEEVVALKILPDNLSNNPEAVRRFKIEARNARKLSHPNIVRIHDIGEEMGRKYISMEYVDGSDLKRQIKTSPDFLMPRENVLHYAIDIADALNYAHKLGIVHRDIKPANIMLTKKGDVKVTDFGIAKMMDQTGESTMLGAVIGTPLYMSPEQVQGRPVDNRADIYSFGVLLYEMLNGRPPFTEGDLAYQHINVDPEPIPSVDDELWGIVLKCLQKEKDHRYANAGEIHEALKEYVKGPNRKT